MGKGFPSQQRISLFIITILLFTGCSQTTSPKTVTSPTNFPTARATATFANAQSTPTNLPVLIFTPEDPHHVIASMDDIKIDEIQLTNQDIDGKPAPSGQRYITIWLVASENKSIDFEYFSKFQSTLEEKVFLEPRDERQRQTSKRGISDGRLFLQFMIPNTVGYARLVWPDGNSSFFHVNAPEFQPIKDAITKGEAIISILFCDPSVDLNILSSVFLNTPDYEPSENAKILITKYLGEEAVEDAGYVTYLTAYYIWDRSGDGYPHSLTEPPTPRPTGGVRMCSFPINQLEFQFLEIDIQKHKAVVKYQYGAYLTEQILRKVNQEWFVVSSHNLSVSP